MKPGNYRARLAGDIFSVLILPLLAFRFVRSTFDLWPGLAAYPAGFAFVLFWAAGKSVYSETLQRWEARSLGTRPIPRVAGRWPGNVDILFKMMRAFKTSYVLDVYRELFEEYQTTTLNLRILWRDNVRPFILWTPPTVSATTPAAQHRTQEVELIIGIDYIYGSRTL